MKRLPTLEYRAEILRGWPDAKNIHMNYASDDDTLTNGDLVLMAPDAKVKRCDKAESVNVGLVVRGPADDKSVRIAGGVAAGEGTKVVGGGNTCIVLFGNFVVRTNAIDQAQSYVVGDFVTASDKGLWTKAADASKALGHILEVSTLSDGSKALVIVVR